ncbi:MAG: hypothetical protein CMJ75_19440 [Planctomycetaceae bacterium]|nr:hypothetical protein [Planctomycetaceae bacterium]
MALPVAAIRHEWAIHLQWVIQTRVFGYLCRGVEHHPIPPESDAHGLSTSGRDRLVRGELKYTGLTSGSLSVPLAV